MFRVGYTVEGAWRLLRRHGLVLAAAGPAGDRT
ncbi:hypothetical protein ACFVRD_29065 [Streptomyces sp. NPDC057908]